MEHWVTTEEAAPGIKEELPAMSKVTRGSLAVIDVPKELGGAGVLGPSQSLSLSAKIGLGVPISLWRWRDVPSPVFFLFAQGTGIVII